MADVSNTSGVNPQQPLPEPAKPGTQKFKDLMKVGDSEKRQKRGKKKQEESEEELKADLRSGAIAPNKDAEAAKKAAKTPKIQEVGESEKREPKKERRPEEIAPEAIEEAGIASTTRANISQFKIESDLKELEEKFTTLSQTTSVQSTSQETVSKEKEVEEETQEKEKVAEGMTFKEQIQKTHDQETASQFAPPASSTLGPLFLAPAPAAPPAYSTLNHEILALFERMVGVISIMKETGVTETTIHLNTAEFSNSRFAGSEIIIREYSTAPMAYNIELVGTPQNAALFEQNIGSLMRAFQTGNYNFHVNRIDTRLQQRTEKPLFQRKEKTSEKKEKE